MQIQIGEVAARTELSLRTIRHYEDIGLVAPSARSQGGFRMYTEGDLQRLMVIRRMKPLGFTLEQMRDLLCVTDRLAHGEPPTDRERTQLAARIGEFEEATAMRAAELRAQLARAEEFAEMLRAKTATLRTRTAKAAAPRAPGR